jgi:flagellar basal body-associated protein FliL
VNGNDLDRASGQLGQQPQKTSKMWLWILIGIVVGIVLVVIGVIFYLFWNNLNQSSTYPYIFAPQNTIRSHSAGELMANLVMDVNETADKYGAYRRLN